MKPGEGGNDFAGIRAHAEACGLIVRGGFHPRADDGVPTFGSGGPARTVVLVGNAGDMLWPVFSASPEAGDGEPHPLDRWSRRVITQIAAEFDGEACFPGDGPPWLPFMA